MEQITSALPYQIGNFSVVMSDATLELMAKEPSILKQAVTMAINYMVSEENDEIPDDLRLYVSKEDNIISLYKRCGNYTYQLNQPLDKWIDVIQEDMELYGE